MPTIHVYVEGGVVQSVEGVPEGWDVEIHDADDEVNGADIQRDDFKGD